MEIFVQGLMLYFPTDPKTRRKKIQGKGQSLRHTTGGDRSLEKPSQGFLKV